MALPEPPSGRSRYLLQTIWDMSSGRRGEQVGWPTFTLLATELDRRLASRGQETVYSGMQAGEAETLLAEMPAGLISGVGSDSPVQPASRQELSLTVAGIAACQDTDNILSLLLRFIKDAVSVEQKGPSSIYPDALPRTRYKEFVARYLISKSRIFRRESMDFVDPVVPRWPSKYRRMQQQLCLILGTEPAWWVKLLDLYDDWVLTFDRRIRYFKDIRNLDDYWSCRFKPWETSDRIPYPVVAETRTPDQLGRPQLLCDHPDLLADVLLGLIFDFGDGLTSVLSCPRVDPDVNSSHIRNALRRLESQGRIRLPNRDTSPDPPDVMLTGAGARHVSMLRRNWANHTFRGRAARDALLAWLYDQRAHPQGRVHIDGFFNDPRSVHEGDFFSLRDIDDTASYLQEKKLIDGTRIDQRRGLVTAWIIASGIDCIEQGGSVAEYAKEPAPTSTNYSFINAPVSGTNVAIGGNVTQHATISSMDKDSLRTLMKAIAEALPGLGLDTQGQKDTENATNQVISEIEQHQPDQPRVRAALGKVREFLSSAGNQALAVVLSAAIDYERAKLGLPPAG